MIRRKWILFFWIFAWIGRSVAGEYGADFLRIGVGAKSLAMGGAFVSVADDGSAFYWNPAGLTRTEFMSVHVDHVPMFQGLAQYNAASVSLGLYNQLAVAVSWIRLGIEDIPRYAPLRGTRFERLTQARYRSTGEAEGYFSDSEDAVMLSIARSLYFDVLVGSPFTDSRIPLEVSFGLTGKYIRQQLDGRLGIGQGLDAGVIVRLASELGPAHEPSRWVSLGVLARDLSTTNLVWTTGTHHRDQVRPGFQAGMAASRLVESVRTRITLSVDREFGFYEETKVGGEVRFFNTLAIRAGYDRNWALGCGLQWRGLRIDYAFIRNDLANTHRISGAFQFKM